MSKLGDLLRKIRRPRPQTGPRPQLMPISIQPGGVAAIAARLLSPR